MEVHDEARYAQVLRFPSKQELVRRFPPLVLGVFAIGFSIAISVRAELGEAFRPGEAVLLPIANRPVFASYPPGPEPRWQRR